MGDGHADITAVAALLAKRWKEDRPYFTLHGITQDIALSSWWVRRRDYAGVEQHSVRFIPAHSRHRCVGMSRPVYWQRGI
jgi:hypothetical protein